MEKLGPFTDADIENLKRILGNLLKLARGERRPGSDAQRQFLRVLDGKLPPATMYEKSFLRWLEVGGDPALLGRPDLGAATSLSKLRRQREQRTASVRRSGVEARPGAAAGADRKSGMSAAEAKRSHRRLTDREKARLHRKSGLNRVTARFVSGGGVNPR